MPAFEWFDHRFVFRFIPQFNSLDDQNSRALEIVFTATRLLERGPSDDDKASSL